MQGVPNKATYFQECDNKKYSSENHEIGDYRKEMTKDKN